MPAVTDPSDLSPWFAVVDPVCGAQVGPVPIAYHVAFGNEDYFFCSIQCAERFKADPAGLLQRRDARIAVRLSQEPAASS